MNRVLAAIERVQIRREQKYQAQLLDELRQHYAAAGHDFSDMTDPQVVAAVQDANELAARSGIPARDLGQSIRNAFMAQQRQGEK